MKPKALQQPGVLERIQNQPKADTEIRPDAKVRERLVTVASTATPTTTGVTTKTDTLQENKKPGEGGPAARH